jgi:AbiJ N-terminal domain 4
MPLPSIPVARELVMPRKQSFSKRHGFSPAKDITIREDAPANLRSFVLQSASSFGWRPGRLRQRVCQVLRVPPKEGMMSHHAVWTEVKGLVDECPWFKAYDIIEALHASFAQSDEYSGDDDAGAFAEEINEFFVDGGIGWQIVGGQIVVRGTEAFEAVVTAAIPALEASERPTAAKHLHEALQDLSRRPQADLPGAAYHAMGSLECVARDLTGDPKTTLGAILKGHPGLLPKSLDTALSQVWGYASNEARHVSEGREISREEAELLVGLSAIVSTYLLRKPKL